MNLIRIAALIVLISLPSVFGQQLNNLNEKLPIDSNVTIGKLDNGLTYYLRKNKKPENRVFMRLIVNAGSILEEDNQQGLAHFVEHMAFNGTKNFDKNEIINYLESIGMRFGADVNAYTSFDETVYMIELPTDSLELVIKGLQILRDWAAEIKFDSLEVEKERGVIIEEWRLGRGANARVFDKQAPILFKNSKYAERLPIGKKEVIETFDHEVLKKFYKDWYRPDLMAIAAVGNVDMIWLEENIKQIFSSIPKVSNSKERNVFQIPDHEDVLYSIVTDPELPQTSISLYYKFPVTKVEYVSDYRKQLIENLYNGMLNSRLEELTQLSEPPFIYAYSGKGNFVRSKNFYVLASIPKEDSILVALNVLLSEAERVRQTGFTATELKRQKSELFRAIEKRFNERETTNSNSFVNQYTSHFLSSSPIPAIEYELWLVKMLLPDITLEEVNLLANSLISDKNYVVLISAPEKEGQILPTENEVKSAIDNVRKQQLTAYKDEQKEISLVNQNFGKAEIIDERKVENLGITELRLANNVRVVLKPTDFKKDEILLMAFSDGGSSLVDDEDYIPAATAVSIVTQSGIGDMNLTELQKFLKGRIINLSPFISELSEGLSGSASPKDLETMFQLVYLNFVSPRLDSSSFLAYKTRLETFLINKSKDPLSVLQDTITAVASNYHPRRMPWNLETLKKLNPQKSFEIYKERFRDASDFTFIFIGSFDVDSIKPFIQTYLGNLPSIKRRESWRDLNIYPPKGVVKREVRKGLEDKSLVNISFSGDFSWSPWEVHKFSAMVEVLKIKLREIIREEMSGTYGVNVYQLTQKFPSEKYIVSISFGCNPSRVDELIQSVMQQIDSLKNSPTDDSYINKVKEIQRREWETNLKENNFWLNRLWTFYLHDFDLNSFYDYAERIERLDSNNIQECFDKYFNKDNYLQIVLKPEERN